MWAGYTRGKRGRAFHFLFTSKELSILLCFCIAFFSPRGVVRGRFAACGLLVLPSALNCSASQLVDPFCLGEVAGRMCSRPKQYTTTSNTQILSEMACIPAIGSCQHSRGPLIVTSDKLQALRGLASCCRGSEHNATTAPTSGVPPLSPPCDHPALCIIPATQTPIPAPVSVAASAQVAASRAAHTHCHCHTTSAMASAAVVDQQQQQQQLPPPPQQQQAGSNSRLVQVAKDVFAGTMGGISVTMVGHPFDTIKVRLQTQPMNKPIYGE